MDKKETMKKVNWFGKCMHIFTVIVLVYSFVNSALTITNTSIHQILLAIWQVKYVMYAVLFQVIALNCRT